MPLPQLVLRRARVLEGRGLEAQELEAPAVTTRRTMPEPVDCPRTVAATAMQLQVLVMTLGQQALVVAGLQMTRKIRVRRAPSIRIEATVIVAQLLVVR